MDISLPPFTFADEDYRAVLRGFYNFRFQPRIVPECHDDPMEMLATAEHEQLHDVLARQTSHGVLIALALRRWPTEDKNQGNPAIDQALEELFDEARFLHEGFAVYNTLRLSRAFAPLLQRLSPDYQRYLDRVEAIIPAKLEGKRTERIFLYGAVAAALSPRLPAPASMDAQSAFLNAAAVVHGCSARWERLIACGPSRLTDMFLAVATETGLQPADLDCPNAYEELQERLGVGEELDAYLTKERRLVEAWTEAVGSRIFAGAPDVTTAKTLAENVRPYRDILAPGYRLETALPTYLGLTLEEYSEIYSLMHESIQSDLGFPLRTQRNFAIKPDAAARALEAALNVLPPPHRYLGVLRGELPLVVQAKVPGQNNGANVEWMLINPELAYYRKHLLETLIVADPAEVLLLLSAATQKRLGVLVPPNLFIKQPEIRKWVADWTANGLWVAQFLPLNLLDLLEWRIDQGASPQSVRVALSPSREVRGCHLLRCAIDDDPLVHVRLVGPSSVLGLLRLKSLAESRLKIQFSLIQSTIPSADDEDCIRFLKLLWR